MFPTAQAAAQEMPSRSHSWCASSRWNPSLAGAVGVSRRTQLIQTEMIICTMPLPLRFKLQCQQIAGPDT